MKEIYEIDENSVLQINIIGVVRNSFGVEVLRDMRIAASFPVRSVEDAQKILSKISKLEIEKT